MRKFKGKLSRFLALALTVSLLTLPEMAVFASANQGVLGSPGKIMSAERFSHATGSDAGMDEGTLEDSKDDVENGEGEEKKVATWANALTGAVSKAKSGEREIKLDGAKVEEEAVNTLLPIEEVDAYLVLNNYSEEHIKAMPVDTMISLLKDHYGDPIEISTDAEGLWAFFKDEDGNVLKDEYHKIGNEETIDLSRDKETRYEMELIVGSGKQLDLNNIRYLITVYISDIIEDFVNYRVGIENSWGSRYFLPGIVKESNILSNIGIPVTEASFYYSSDRDDYNCYLVMDSDIDEERKDIRMDIYPMINFLRYYQDGEPLDGAITDSVLHSAAPAWYGGYCGEFNTYDSLEGYLNADNMFCVVYTDANTGAIIAYQGLLVKIESNDGRGKFFLFENGKMLDVTWRLGGDSSCYNRKGNTWRIKLADEGNGVTVDYKDESEIYRLNYLDYSEDKYYYVLNPDVHIKKVVRGSFDSIEEAEKAGAEDVTDQIIPTDTDNVQYGYKANYKQFIDFTIFFDDGTSQKYKVKMRVGDNDSEKENIEEFDEAPNLKSEDSYFRVNSAVGYNTFVLQNDSETILDTLYGYGYQTLFISEDSADLSHLKPVFSHPDYVQIYAGEKQESGVTEHDFSKGMVQYEASIGDNVKNYFVTFKKKESGPKLFVNGPSERTIFLDEYFENRHDILIANFGDEELTGLKVELLNAVNVKLDDYWVIGGENNETLPAYSYGWYGELPNLAKVSLLPDGEGEVSGTLKISADGQEDVYIKLTGYAGNPNIVTESLSDAVKYVPYSYMIATNNIHSWNKVTFSIEEGKLPEGLELYSATGEIYGTPLETGEFPIKVKASYSREEFSPSYADFTLSVKENTDENVYLSSDKGYELIEHIGTETVEGTYDYLVSNIADQLFVSSGEYNKFIDLWLNGEKLVDGVDYTKESGSTKITVKSQTFQEKAKSGSNTIAAEFREKDESKELKRTAQNFKMDLSQSDDNQQTPSDNGTTEDNEKPGTSDSNPGDNASPDDNTQNVIPNPDDNRNPENSDNSDRNSERRKDRNERIVVDPNRDITRYNDDSWVKDEIGWRCKMPDGNWITNTWFRLPYQGTVEWYYFNEQGYMVTGLLAHNGLLYYLNPISDGTQGKMITGWKKIDGKWYYFKEIDDGTMGAMMSDVWIGEYYVNSQGVWEG